MSTKSEEWKEFKKCREDIMSNYTRPEQSAMKQKWTDECLVPLGYNHEFEFVRCKEKSDDEKAKLFNEWSDMFKDGKFNPDRKPKATKKVKPKRGASLDDLSLDEPVIDKPDTTNIKEPTEVDKVVDQQVKEIPDLVEQPKPVTKQPKIIDKLNEKTVDAMQKHKEEITMASTTPKSKKELLLEAISALEEEENTGITEEQVKKICVSVFCDLFKEVIDSMHSKSMSLLNQIKKDEEE